MAMAMFSYGFAFRKESEHGVAFRYGELSYELLKRLTSIPGPDSLFDDSLETTLSGSLETVRDRSDRDGRNRGRKIELERNVWVVFEGKKDDSDGENMMVMEKTSIEEYR